MGVNGEEEANATVCCCTNPDNAHALGSTSSTVGLHHPCPPQSQEGHDARQDVTFIDFTDLPCPVPVTIRRSIVSDSHLPVTALQPAWFDGSCCQGQTNSSIHCACLLQIIVMNMAEWSSMPQFDSGLRGCRFESRLQQ